VTVKPVLIGRKNAGVLECHSNGFRFTTTKGARGDLIFSNIKHAFYQEAGDTSPAVVLHFHLKDEIIWGKKKTKDVQFYVEVVDMSQDLSNIRSRYGDQDGIQEEQEERMLRQKTNERFLDFVKRCEDACPSIKTSFKSFDAPYRALKFVGVPGKQMVDLMPTMHCLTALDDIPPFVLTLADVELAHFERVAGSLKNFDLVFVFKDYNRYALCC
jgi:nucleosome binding factor SPN SPT16 subunit